MRLREGKGKMKRRRLVFIRILLALTFLFLSSCQAKNPNRYVNKKDNFSIEFPPDWEIKENYYGTTVMALSSLENENDNFRENVNVVVEVIPDGTSLNDYFSASVSNLKQLNNFNDEFSGYDEFNNNKTKWLYYSHEMGTYKLKVILYQFINGNKAYSITCTAKEEDFEKFKKQFKDAASTFNFE